MNALARRADALAAAAFGALYFVLRVGLKVLDPSRVDLYTQTDFAYHVLGFQFYQHDRWRWPVTQIGNYLWPAGTSTVYTDANPWVSLVAKLVVPASAPPYQLVGAWLCLCLALQGYFGARLCRRVLTEDRVVSALGGCLFVLAPVLLARFGHDALCAHWLILAAMTEALAPREGSLWRFAALLTFAAGLHPTLFAMLPAFGAVVLLRTRPRGRELGAVAAWAAGPLLIFVAFGTLKASTRSEVPGFGLYSANVLSLLDPMEVPRSRVLPVLPHEPMQYEGFGFLGAGLLALLGAGLVVRRWSPRSEVRWAFVFAPALALAFYALSNRIFVGHRLVAELSALYAPFHVITNSFRSSGRFVWPLIYALVLLGVAGVANLPRPWGAVALALAVVLQGVDGWDVLDPVGLFRADTTTASEAWKLVDGDYDALLLDPANIESNGFICLDSHYEPRHFTSLANVAVQRRLLFNSGQAARLNEGSLFDTCNDRIAERARHVFDPRAIYAPAADIQYGPEDGMACGTIDGARICVRDDRPSRFRDWLRANPAR